MKIPQAAHTSFQSAPSSRQTFLMTSSRPSRMPTMSLKRSHQFSNPSSLSLSGTLSSSMRSVFTFPFHLRDATAKSRSALKLFRRGWSVRRGDNCCARPWRYEDGCLERTCRKNADAFDSPRSDVLYNHALQHPSFHISHLKIVPCQIWPECRVFPRPLLAAEVVALLSRRLDEVGIQPFHELISDRNILEARLWEVKDGE